MILDFLNSDLNGESWENLCIACYKMRYASEHFTDIPANRGGDGGIEGYTENGIVIQCYCPLDKNLSHQDLYENLRDKMTQDINKFIDEKNSKNLKKLGIPPIKEWHFVIPEYKDNRILEHKTKKIQLVKKTRESNLELYDYISEDFRIIVKVAEDFRIELSRILRSSLTDIAMNIELSNYTKPDWSKSDNTKINNIKRKILAIAPNLEDNLDSFNHILDLYMTHYLEGIEKFERLGKSFPDIRKDLLDLETAFKMNVTTKTLMNTDKTLNSKIFNELGDEFEKKLREDFSFLSNTTTMNLKWNLVCKWLADCSMEFKGAD